MLQYTVLLGIALLVLVLLFCIYMIRKSAIYEGKANEEKENAEYNRILQEKYADVSSRPADSVDSLLNRLRTDGSSDDELS